MAHAVEHKAQDEWHPDGVYSDEHEHDMVALAARYVPDTPEEKALVRKIDRHIVPMIWLLYTLSYLDRANIGNAKTGGLQTDFKLTSDQYSVVLLVFFVSRQVRHTLKKNVAKLCRFLTSYSRFHQTC